MAQQPTVLLVEDDAASAYAVGRYLRAQGYRVIAESRAIGALDQWEQNKIDVVVADVRLAPDGPDGILLAQMLKHERGDIPIFFMTGYPETVDGKGNLPGPVFLKPFRLSELQQAIEHAAPLKRRGATQFASNETGEIPDRREHDVRARTRNAVAEFIDKGGQVVKGPETVVVTGSEVIEYLLTCGVLVKCLPSGSTAHYKYKGEHVTLRKLVEVANRYRFAQRLPPFVPKV